MKNKYSLLLFAIMIGLVLLGIAIIVVGAIVGTPFALVGVIPIILGALMLLGFQWPPDASTSKVWLITSFGKLTSQKAEGLTLLLTWPANIIGKVEIDLKKVDHDFKLVKPIRCADGIYMDDQKSRTSTTMFADNTDDDPAVIAEPKKAGQKLRDFQNIGGLKGAQETLDDILTSWLQFFANEWTSAQMEMYGDVLAGHMLPVIRGVRGATPLGANPDIDDVRGTGVAFSKFQVILLPPQSIVDARNDVQIQTDKRRAQLVGTESMNLQIAERLKLYRLGKQDAAGNWIVLPTPENLIPPLDQIRNMIVQENLVHDQKVSQVINRGGLNVVNATT